MKIGVYIEGAEVRVPYDETMWRLLDLCEAGNHLLAPPNNWFWNVDDGHLPVGPFDSEEEAREYALDAAEMSFEFDRRAPLTWDDTVPPVFNDGLGHRPPKECDRGRHILRTDGGRCADSFPPYELAKLEGSKPIPAGKSRGARR